MPSVGTFTFGVGGTYLTLAAAVASIVTPLTGNLTYVQVSDDIQVGSFFSFPGPAVDLAGFDLTFTSAVPHGGSPAVGFKCVYLQMVFDKFFGGRLIFDDIYLAARYNGSGGGLSIDSQNQAYEVIIRKSLFEQVDVPGAPNKMALALNCGSPLVPAYAIRFQVLDSKFWGPYGGLQFQNGAGAAYAVDVHAQFENICCYASDAARAGGRAFAMQGNGASGLGLNPDFFARNVMCWVASPSTQYAYYNVRTDAATFFYPRMSSNARNGGIDGAPWAYDGITTPVDVMDLSAANANFLNTRPGTAMDLNGAATVLPGNIYGATPYPIGYRGFVSPGPVNGIWPWCGGTF